MYSPSAALSSRGGTPSSGQRQQQQQRPSSRSSSFADERRQIALAEVSSRGQVRREVENAAARVYQQEVREQRDANLDEKRLRVQELEDAHKHDVDARNRSALAARIDRSALDVDEVLQDKRLHAAMEAKLGRLTYMREQARVQRVLGTTRALLKRKEQEKQQKETLTALLENVHSKESRRELLNNNTTTSTQEQQKAPQITVATGSTSPTRKQNSSSRPGSSAEGQQREADINTRKRMVDKLLQREEQQRGFQPRPSVGSRGTISQALPYEESVSSRSHTPTPQLPRHQQQAQQPYPQQVDAFGRPLSRANPPADDVDWSGPLGSHGSPSNAAHGRPMSRQSQDRLFPHSRLSSASSSIHAPLTRGGSSSTSMAMHHRSGLSSGASSAASRRDSASRYMLPHENRPRVDLPPLPALSTPSPSPHHYSHPPPRPNNNNAQRSGSAATNASYSSSTILDPFPEENAKAYHVMERHYGSQRNLLNFQRRPNSRGAEEQQAFTKHSMRVLGDMILGHSSGGSSPPGSRQGSRQGPRRARSTSPNQQHSYSHDPRRQLQQFSRPSSSLSEYPTSHQHYQSGLVVVDGSSQQRHPSPINGGRREFRTVQTSSRMLYHSIAGGICPPMSNHEGQLDHFEQHVANRSMQDAEEWVRIFGRHRAPFVPRPRGHEEDEVDVEEEVDDGEMEGVPAQQFIPPQSYEMVDMRLPDEFHERRVGGGEWVTVLPTTTTTAATTQSSSSRGGVGARRHQNDAFEDEEGLIGRDDDSTSSHITSGSRDADHTADMMEEGPDALYNNQYDERMEGEDMRAAATVVEQQEVGERLILLSVESSPNPTQPTNFIHHSAAATTTTTLQDNSSSRVMSPSDAGDHHLATPPQQPFEELRAQLQAHHGGVGGDSPSRRRTYRGSEGREESPTTTSTVNIAADSERHHHHRHLRASSDVTGGKSSDGEESGEYDRRVASQQQQPLQDVDPDHHAYQMPTSVLPRHEPDFSFDNFLAGNFEVQPEQPSSFAPPPASQPGRPVSRGDGVGGGDRPTGATRGAGPSRVMAEDEDETFPAPPADASRFVDFGSSSDDDDDDGYGGGEFDDDDEMDDGGEVPPQAMGLDVPDHAVVLPLPAPVVEVLSTAQRPSVSRETSPEMEQQRHQQQQDQAVAQQVDDAAPLTGTNTTTEQVAPTAAAMVAVDEPVTQSTATDDIDATQSTAHASGIVEEAADAAEPSTVTPRTVNAAADAVATELVSFLMAEWD
ncbi:Hypothetical protein, putative [Bodo saltans]|uniref:Uncharacterized protein n=1 Tax=Bodo saltans TaxID=75058 RepID=A0A0S4IWV4_BODSA|nr:Hypothetical protein, putative [Bodo saltans]|eukprot:CUG05947.1 Hypothetical protein, putative [Bodo saltans]